MKDDLENYPIFWKVVECTDRFPVMSETSDQLVEASIFNFFKPRSIVEIGAGSGNWCILMDTVSDESHDRHFILIDNFSWAADDRYKHGAKVCNFPVNVRSLEDHLSPLLTSFEIMDGSIDVLIENDLKEQVDLIRVDCDPTAQEKWSDVIEWIDHNGSDRLIVLADDVNLNVAPYRMLLLQQLVATGKLVLFWIGEDTAAWCRPSMLADLDGWIEYVRLHNDLSDALHIHDVTLMLHGYLQTITITSKSHSYQQMLDHMYRLLHKMRE